MNLKGRQETQYLSVFSLHINTLLGFSYASMCMMHSHISLHILQQSEIGYISLYIFNRREFFSRENAYISPAISSPSPKQADLCICLFYSLLLLHLVCSIPLPMALFILELVSNELAVINQTTLM